MMRLDSPPQEAPLKKLGIISTTCQPVKKQALPDGFDIQPVSQILKTLTQAVKLVLDSGNLGTSHQALFHLCELITVHSQECCLSLYNTIKIEIERHLSRLREFLQEVDVTCSVDLASECEASDMVSSSDGDAGELGFDEEREDRQRATNWLEVFCKRWDGFNHTLELLCTIFSYLDRVFVHRSNLTPIKELANIAFTTMILSPEHLGKRIAFTFELYARKLVLHNVTRPEALFVRSKIKVFQAFSSKVAQKICVEPTLKATENALREYAKGSKSGSELMVNMESLILRNQKKWGMFRTKTNFRDSVVSAVIEDQMEAMINTELDFLLESDETPALVLLYSYSAILKNNGDLRNKFSSYIEKKTCRIFDSQDIGALVTFRQKMIKIVNECFIDFGSAVKEGLSNAINDAERLSETKPDEMIATFLDRLLKSGHKAMSEQANDEMLAETFQIFRLLKNKDVFEAFYKRDLAKRLIFNRSASLDNEYAMFKYLKEACGPIYSEKLESMITDIKVSQDTLGDYNPPSSGTISLTVNTLSSSSWPSYPIPKLILPPPMANLLESFKLFYVSRFAGRTLTWQYGLDTCIVRTTLRGVKKELNLSLVQTLILLLFNPIASDDRLSFQDILDGSGLDSVEATRTLQSLACGKIRILTKHPKSKDINETDQFSVNNLLKHDAYRIKINQIQQEVTKEERVATRQRAVFDRAAHLDLAIVRIMKANKTMKYSQILMEAASAVGNRFAVDNSDIKKTISSLLERDYIKRSEEDSNVFTYIS